MMMNGNLWLFVWMIGMMSCLTTIAMAQDAGQSKAQSKEALSFKMKSIDGKEVDLSKYKGKVIVVVNTASKCGMTPQYAGLQKLYEENSPKGLLVLGFPCNQFGRQEPGTDSEIKSFCTENYGVSFPMFAKVDVNGRKQAPFFKNLSQMDLQPKGPGKVQWNFEKFVIDRNGKPIARFSPRTKPNDPEFQKVIKTALSQ